MTDFLIANTGGGWDLALTDGDLTLTHTISRAQEVAQRVVYRLMTWFGESPYERTAGIPYEEGVFGSYEPVPGIVAMMIQEILDTPGVDEVLEDPTFELGTDRVLAIGVAIRVGDEDVPLTLTVNP